MKLRHFGLLALLGILSWSCADDKGLGGNSNGSGKIETSSIKADYSVAISQNTTAGTASSEDEPISPDLNDFMLHLVKVDGGFNKTWSSIAEFPVEQKFATGNYEMELYYGDINEEGFEKPYYYGSSKFFVEDAETINPEIVATLGNSMVSLVYTDAFKQYFTSYSAKVSTAAGNSFEFANDETRAIYVKPGKVSFQLTLVKTNGVELIIEPAAIDKAEARTYYRVTFDVNGGEVGDAKLSVSFSDATTTSPIIVALSDDLAVAPAPTITAKDFVSGTAMNIIEGDDAKASVVLVAESGLKSAVLTTSSEYLTSVGWPAEIDLVSATAEQKTLLKQYGLDVKGLWENPDRLAMVDFSALISNLKPLNGKMNHSFSLQVTDVYGRTAQAPVTLSVNTSALVFEMSNPIKSVAGSLKAAFTFAFNGNKDKLSFKAKSDGGVYEDVQILSWTEAGTNIYTVTITIPDNATSTTVKGYYRGEDRNTSVDIKIGMTFSLDYKEYDVWATKATVNVGARVADFKNVVMNNVKTVYVNGAETTNYTKNESNYTFTIAGLTAGASNDIKIVVSDSDGDDVSSTIAITTETAAQVGNAGFEEWETLVWNYTQVTKGTMNYYKPWTSGTTDAWWDSNTTTSLVGSFSAAYTYFKCFPLVHCSTDSHSGSKSAQFAVVNVGGGNSLIGTTGSWHVGELFIGKGNDGTEGGWSRTSTGHSFSSRPTSLSFWYEYAPYGTDACLAEIQVLAADGTVIGSASASADQTVSEWTEAVLPINYTVTNKKAASIYIAFKASTSSSHSCKASGSRLEINGSTDTTDGGLIKLSSVLRIDDIVLNY